MSNYIHPNNQTLLWNLLHKNPLISQISQSSKNDWFKQIISQIYSTLPPTISNDVLLNKNKETLAFMINDLKKRIKEPVVEREYTITSEYEERQKEYERMMKKPVVEEISFKEESNDGVIKNMDELIQKQLREREQDLERIYKTYELLDDKITDKKIPDKKIPDKKTNENKKLDIKETIKDELGIVNLPIEKKSVSWGKDSITEYNYILETKIDELNKKYDDLLEYLERRIPNFTKDLEERKIIKDILSEKIEIISK